MWQIFNGVILSKLCLFLVNRNKTKYTLTIEQEILFSYVDKCPNVLTYKKKILHFLENFYNKCTSSPSLDLAKLLQNQFQSNKEGYDQLRSFCSAVHIHM